MTGGWQVGIDTGAARTAPGVLAHLAITSSVTKLSGRKFEIIPDDWPA